MALIPPMFLDCVTAIGFRDAQAKINFGATGFLFGRLEKVGGAPGTTTYRVYLVTNRHVFEGSTVAVLRFNPQAGAGGSCPCVLASRSSSSGLLQPSIP